MSRQSEMEDRIVNRILHRLERGIGHVETKTAHTQEAEPWDRQRLG